MKKIFLIIGSFAITTLYAQKKAPENWFLLNPKTDNVYGVGSEEAYKTLANKKPKTVIVAVIDSGTEIDHEDLKDNIWVNEDEIPNNGIDDDNNGYIDDVNGWSFLGGKNGDIEFEATELARIYQRMTKKFAKTDTNNLSSEDAKAFEEYKTIRTTFRTEQAEQAQQLQGIGALVDLFANVKKENNGVLSKSTFSSYVPKNEVEAKIQKKMKKFFLIIKPEELDAQLTMGYESMSKTFKYNQLNVDSIRQAVVGDDPNNMNERYYGCNRVEGPDALHGTHVSGIIAAMRNNNLGIRGIAENVKIMPVRAVPSGDERDKDIANAIRYAVDNGATIINMSFGKYYSPNKSIIDDAIKYAMSKDVLLVHAAGNESKNCDVELSYPTRDFTSGGEANNWIQVGASSYKKSKNILGSFSNYGKAKVDLFAPGVDVYSTVCDSKYISESGTSMASPAVAGVAAIIRSYFPELKASEVREILMKTVVPYKKAVIVPGTKEKKLMSDLCISGGFINTNNAVIEILKQKK
ncbi:MAG: S8 family peptidase [Bacteroidota bacterium]